jgi:prepilin-type N-terminal cleavage/methylation domain-containing protein
LAARGLTLLELVVALAVTAIVATLAWPRYQNWQDREGLEQAVMYVQSAISAARSRSTTAGWTCGDGNAPGGGPSCDTLYFGAEVVAGAEPARVRLIYFCDRDSEVCQRQGAPVQPDEVHGVWSRRLSPRVAVDPAGTTLSDNRVVFDKFGAVLGNAGTVRLRAGKVHRDVVVSSSGRVQTE